MVNDIFWMKRALFIAERAFNLNKVPVASVVVSNNFELGTGFNIFAHAEIVCLKQTSFYLSNHILSKCTLYTTLEPCYVCLSTIFYMKLERVVFSAYYKKYTCKSFLKTDYYDANLFLTGGLLQDDSNKLLNKFFNSIR